MSNYIGQGGNLASQTAGYTAFWQNTMAAEVAQGHVSQYLFKRKLALGIPDNAIPALLMEKKPGSQSNPWPLVNLRARLAIAGTGFGAATAQLSAEMAQIVADINAVVTGLGGLAGISATGDWGWLLAKNPDGTYLFFPAATPNTFTLPGLVFTIPSPTQNPSLPMQFVTVIITVASDGSATVAYTANGAAFSPDPM